MGYFPVSYDYRVVIYEHKMIIRLPTVFSIHSMKIVIVCMQPKMLLSCLFNDVAFSFKRNRSTVRI